MASELRFPDGPPVDIALLSRYVAQDCTDAEREQVERWLAADPSREGIVRAMRERQHDGRGDGDVAAAWARFHATRLAPIVAEERAEVPARRSTPEGASTSRDGKARSSRIRRVGVASTFSQRAASLGRFAAAILVIAAAGIAIRVGTTRNTHTVAATYTAAVGQLKPVTLPDGSRVVLAPGTRLRVDAEYGGGHRDVYLDGKGSFAIAADPARPFAVIANGIRVQVLGTTFVVDRYGNDTEARVAVKSGRVIVTKSLGTEGSEVLGAGDAIDASDTDSLIVQHDTDVDAAFIWTSGVLVFSNTPLSKVIADVERWYGVRIVIGGGAASDMVYQRRVTTKFDRQPLSVVTHELSMILGVPVSATTAPGATAPSV